MRKQTGIIKHEIAMEQEKEIAKIRETAKNLTYSPTYNKHWEQVQIQKVINKYRT